jgi:hypothetical protein
LVEAMERAAMFGKKKNNTGAGVQNNGDGR